MKSSKPRVHRRTSVTSSSPPTAHASQSYGRQRSQPNCSSDDAAEPEVGELTWMTSSSMRRCRCRQSHKPSMLALFAVHLVLVIAVGVHNEWGWSTELLDLFTDFATDTASLVTFGVFDRPSDVTSGGENCRDYLNVSLRTEFSFDWKLALAARERHMTAHRDSIEYNRHGVDKKRNLSLEEFRDVYDGKWPVIIQDVVETWIASNWTHEYLCETYGQERVTMKAVTGGLDAAEMTAVPLNRFCKHANDTQPDQWTYVEDELFLPTRRFLRKDIGTSVYTDDDLFSLFPEEVRPWDAMLLWGTKYSRSSLHVDPYNWTGTNAVFTGRKRWKLFHPGQDHLLYVTPNRESNFPLNCYKYNSVVDVFNESHAARYPLITQAEYIEVDQLPGELMIIPPGWFHQVYNCEETIAVSGQIANVNNYRVVLEEILKMKSNLQRSSIPESSQNLSAAEQVKLMTSLLSREVLDHGRNVTSNILAQMHSE